MDGNRWIKVDLDKILHNYRQVRALLKADTQIMAVVKANAYGLGMVPVAKTLAGAGVNWFGVTYVAEGLKLRAAGIKSPILVFAPPLPEQVGKAVAAGLTLTVSGARQVARIGQVAKELGINAPVHLKIETGMGRTGILPGRAREIAAEIISNDNLTFEGIYTHFPRAADRKFTERQYRLFSRVVADLEQSGIFIPLVHCCNSAAALNYPRMHRSLVRVGTLFYGQYPGGSAADLDLRDPWTAQCRVIYLRQVPAGTGVGYGHEFVTRRNTHIGIIPMGFADGFAVTAISRAKSWPDLFRMLAKTVLSFFGRAGGQLQVYYQGKAYPVVGRVGMQLSMVDFGELPAVNVGDTVTVFLRRVTADSNLERCYFLNGERVFLDSGTMVAH